MFQVGLPSRSSLRWRCQEKNVRLREGDGATVYALLHAASVGWRQGDYAPASDPIMCPIVDVASTPCRLWRQGDYAPASHPIVCPIADVASTPCRLWRQGDSNP